MNNDEYGTPDEENPEWTPEMFSRAKRFHELPPEMQAGLQQIMDHARAERAKKVPVSLHLSKAVADGLSALGPEWEARVEDHLAEWLKEQTQAAA